MDLTTPAPAPAAIGGETTEEGEVGIVSLSDKTLPYWKIPRQSLPPLKYKECLRNHAARLGGHAVDGCGEFMLSPAATPSDPKSLECVACGCHRNFHRPDDDSVSITAAQFLSFRRHPTPIPLLPPPRVLLHPTTRSGAQEDHGTVLNAHQPATPTEFKTAENPQGRKRHRTKFTRDQKEKMFCFSERLGWKIQKSDELRVDEFCNEIGVGKGVLKVWMHNNKHAVRKQESNDINITTAGILSFHSNGCTN